MSANDRLVVQVLPNVTNDSPDWLSEVTESVLASIAARGWYARVSTGKRECYIEVSKHNTKPASEILSSIVSVAKEFGISPQDLLDQIERMKENDAG